MSIARRGEIALSLKLFLVEIFWSDDINFSEIWELTFQEVLIL